MNWPNAGIFAVEFENTIDLMPFPVHPRRAARQALRLREHIERAGGVEAAIEAAVAVILAASPDDPPSELERLRLLYQHAYSHEELRGLVSNTFAALGLLP